MQQVRAASPHVSRHPQVQGAETQRLPLTAEPARPSPAGSRGRELRPPRHPERNSSPSPTVQPPNKETHQTRQVLAARISPCAGAAAPHRHPPPARGKRPTCEGEEPRARGREDTAQLRTTTSPCLGAPRVRPGSHLRAGEAAAGAQPPRGSAQHVAT